jgi:prepilin-type processing-associated H-X9-DG protein
MKGSICAIVTLGLAALPAAGQTPDLADVFLGKMQPLTLHLKDLSQDPAWRRVSIGTQGDANPFAAMFGGGGTQSTVYYTRGESLAVAGETFMIAYRVRSKPVDLTSVMRSGSPAPTPPTEKLTPATLVHLGLLNLRTCGNLGDVRPFNIAEEIAASVKLAEEITSTPVVTSVSIGSSSTTKSSRDSSRASQKVRPEANNLELIGSAVVMYALDYNGRLPNMKTAAAMKKALMPYVKSDAAFRVPGTTTPYLPNAVLSGHKLDAVSNGSRVAVAYEPRPGKDGKRGVAFADGHAKRLTGAEWIATKKASGIR